MARRGGHKSYILHVPEPRLRVPEPRLRVPKPRITCTRASVTRSQIWLSVVVLQLRVAEFG